MSTFLTGSGVDFAWRTALAHQVNNESLQTDRQVFFTLQTRGRLAAGRGQVSKLFKRIFMEGSTGSSVIQAHWGDMWCTSEDWITTAASYTHRASQGGKSYSCASSGKPVWLENRLNASKKSTSGHMEVGWSLLQTCSIVPMRNTVLSSWKSASHTQHMFSSH